MMNKEYALDLLERVVVTFLQAVLAVVAVDGTDITSLSVWEGAALAGAAAVLSLLKGILARYVGAPDSAALLK
jgi:hypothetical protein